MNEPDAERLLKLLAQDPQPKLSPYFEARLRRGIAVEQQELAQTARIRKLVIRGGVALLLFSVLILWTYPGLRWLIPIAILQFLPEDWFAGFALRKRPRATGRQ